MPISRNFVRLHAADSFASSAMVNAYQRQPTQAPVSSKQEVQRAAASYLVLIDDFTRGEVESSGQRRWLNDSDQGLWGRGGAISIAPRDG